MKTLDGPIKNPENPRSNFSPIVGNFQPFPEKSNFFRKNLTFPQINDLSPAKILMTFFLLFSHQLLISNFPPIFATDTALSLKLMSRLIPYFSAKPHEKMVFSVKFEKTQDNPKVFFKTKRKAKVFMTKTHRPIPRSGQKNLDLERKPKEWQRWYLVQM